MPPGIKAVRIKTPEFLVRRKKLLSIIGIAVFFTYLLYSFIFSNLGIIKYLSVKKDYESISQEISDLKDKNQKMREDIKALKSDPAYVEGLAREQLGLVKEGEIIYRFREQEDK